MNRFIFRIWNKIDEKYENGFLIDSSGLLHKWNDVTWQFCPVENQNNYIIQQWIGTYDKTNKLIFEGDIVLVPSDYGGDNYQDEKMCIVEYLKEDACYELDCLQDYLWGKIEIVDNIFENPELLRRIKCGKH